MGYTIDDATAAAKTAWQQAGLPADQFQDLGARVAALSHQEYTILVQSQMPENQAREITQRFMQNHIAQSATELQKRYSAEARRAQAVRIW